MHFPSIFINSLADPGQGECGKLAFLEKTDGYLIGKIQALV